MEINNSLVSLYEKAKSLSNQERSLMTTLSAIELRYLNEVPVGEGGVKTIKKVRDEVTGRFVAMALLTDPEPDDNAIENFLREARITASLQHPNIVPIYDIGINQQGAPYFTMKLLEGATLAEYIQKSPTMGELVEIFKKISEGIAYAHSRGIIHLDLKPENIYIGKFGDVVICDWGLARIVMSDETDEIIADDDSLDAAEVSHLTMNGYVRGTPGFMAPEQARGKSYKDQKTDIFSLGAILFFMLTKEAPFTGTTFEEVRSKTLNDSPSLPDQLTTSIPASLEAIYQKAMEKEPAKRYNSAIVMIQDLESYLHGFATEAENASLMRQLKLLYQRHKIIFNATFIIIATVCFAIVLFIRQQEENLLVIATKERDAREALEKYEMEKSDRQKIQEDSSYRYYLNANNLFKAFRFDNALQEVERALLFNPKYQPANALHGKILFAYYRMDEAIHYFNIGDKGQKNFFMPLATFAMPRINPDTGRLNNDDYLTLISMTPEPNTVVKYMMDDVFAQAMTLEERVRMVKEILLIRNPGIKKLNFLYDNETKTLDLSNNPTLTNIDSLKFLPVKHLNLSKTAVVSLERIQDMNLQSLDLSDTFVVSLHELNYMPLNTLNLNNTGFTDLTTLKKFPLKNIDLRNTRVNSLKILESIDTLIKVDADWQRFKDKKEQFLQLKKD
jgi:eukaryotic-like serine/threonine-protein kinase